MGIPAGVTRAHKNRLGAAGVGEGALGALFGVGVGFFLFVGGMLISLTGIGVLIGLPLMLAGAAVAIFAGPLVFLIRRGEAGAKWWGSCPYCGHSLWATGVGFDCPACGQRVIVRGGWFMTVAASQSPPA